MNSPSVNARRNGGSDGSNSGKRLQGLDPLGEVEEDDSESEDEEIQAATSRLQQDSNKFEMLCDGVLNSLALVQASLADFLLLKDELLQHALPASLMARLTTTSGRVFRSSTDLHTPVTELVRLVRVYSDSWEAKSAALKKLHSDYESKHKQLNIAIRRLQLAEATQKRIAREKRIMNWEKLFAKLTSCRGHGRRWKFLIDSFKQKAKLGADHLQHYIDTLDRQMDEDEDEDDPFPDSMSRSSAGDFKTISSLDDELDFDSDEDEEEEEDDVGSMMAAGHRTRQTDMDGSDTVTPGGKKVKFKEVDNQAPEVAQQRLPPDGSAFTIAPLIETKIVEVPAPKPPSADKSMWTHEPQYDYSLNVKLCRPVGVDRKDLKCSVNFRKQFRLSEVYEKPATPGKGKTPPHRGGLKGKTLMGSRGPPLPGARKGGVTFGETSDRNPEDEKFKLVTVPIGEQPLFELPGPEGAPSTIPLPGDQADATHKNTDQVSDKASEDQTSVTLPTSESSRPSTTSGEDAMKLGVHHGQIDEMVAWASISLADLKSMDIVIKESAEEAQDLVPTSFPIYPVVTSRSERSNLETACGYVKVAFYYTRVLRPYTLDKETEADTVNGIVLDMTGVDLTKMRKEDLSINKKYEERCLSAMSVASTESSEKPEMVLKADVDLIVEQHENEMLELQKEYEIRLTQLAASLEALQTEQLESLESKTPHESGKRSSSTLQGWTDGMKSGIKAPPASRELGPIKRKGKRAQTLPEWGSNLPKDFFDRMRLFESEKAENMKELEKKTKDELKEKNFFDRMRLFESEKAENMKELEKKTKDEVEEKILKQLASQYKLRLEAGDSKAIEKDVCLPAVFMPSRAGALYNPRAHHYFHPSGAVGQLRLTQPPSMFQLPPLPSNSNNHMSVINLFDIKRNFEKAMGLETLDVESVSEFGQPHWDSAPNTPSQFYSQPASPQTPHTPNKLEQGLDTISERQSVT